jgi:gluconokinase
MIVVVMGVSGSGKSSVCQALTAKTGWTFIEGDDLHPAKNRKKMASGKPLADDDRWPWLDAIAASARAIDTAGGSAVIACSALKRSYRDRLARAGASVTFVHLSGDHETILARMQARQDHFMPAGLLDSQFAALEPPTDHENACIIDITLPIDDIAQQVMDAIEGRT